MKSVAGNLRANPKLVEWILIVFLCVAAFIPRLSDLGTFLTADEKTWIVRSYEFIRAFKDVRFNDMLQTTHPGVTTLWAGGTAITAKMFISDLPFASSTLIYYVKTAQFPIVLLNALAIPLMYILMKRLFPKPVAFLGALFIALDPFIIGYSRVIHVDALLGSFLTLAVLSTLLYAKSFERTWLIASAVCSALALLTKVPAIFIIPFTFFSIVTYNFQSIFKKDFLVKICKDILVWGLIILLIVLVVWPALLFVPNPIGNVLAVRRDVVVAATTPHNMAEEYSLKPWHYIAALLGRSNPITFVGGIAGIIGLIILAKKRAMPREVFLIAVYLFGFVLMMTLGAKKGDRYIIPAFFALNILAAWGIYYFIKNRRTLISIGLLSTVYLLSVVISYHPYEIAYANPLFPDNLSQELGWGEGLDQVATWLNANHPNVTVASWYPQELGAFTTAKVLHINAHQQNQVRFVVLYKNMFGREPSHYANDFIDEYYKKQEPVFRAYIYGKEFAWVYEKPSYSKTVGDLNAQTIAIQEIIVSHTNLAGFDILPATRGGFVDTGTLIAEVATSVAGPSLFTTEISIKTLKDTSWYQIIFPESLSIKKGDHIFIRIRAQGSSSPYASVRYSQTVSRTTPVYISRTGIVSDAEPKPGSLGVRLTYHALDGTIATEYQTKLLTQ